jgi:DNA-binding transcriptional MocR family regulator
MLLIALANFANGEGLCWPSIKSLAHDSDLGERHVSAELKELARDGYITIEEHAGKSNHYRLHLAQGVNCGSGVKPAIGVNHSAGVNHCASRTTVQGGGEPQFTTTPEPQFTQTVKRTVKEPSVRAKARPMPVPDDFEVTEKMYEWAAKNGWSRNQADRDTEQFLDYHRGKGSRQADWTATWRTWMRNTDRFGSVFAAKSGAGARNGIPA